LTLELKSVTSGKSSPHFKIEEDVDMNEEDQQQESQLRRRISENYTRIITYAKKELSQFHSQYNKEINHLMGFIV
jgi:hypothetical protein